ncbi:hypothetical protein, partial [Cronobacter sakazakii]|uniref:hypothetical protein n=1 Tax=Cronobacter sakazakii TaxID=28141 RepID=UPI00215D7D33
VVTWRVLMSSVIAITLTHFDVELRVQEAVKLHAPPRPAGLLVRPVFQHPAAVFADVFQVSPEAFHVERLAIQIAGDLVRLAPEGAD